MNNVMKIKTYKRTVDIATTEHEYPLYLYWQCEDAINNYHSKITKTNRTDISFNFDGGIKVEVKPHQEGSPIEEHWLHHKCNKSVWEEAVKEIKNQIKL